MFDTTVVTCPAIEIDTTPPPPLLLVCLLAEVWTAEKAAAPLPLVATAAFAALLPPLPVVLVWGCFDADDDEAVEDDDGDEDDGGG